MRKAIARLTVLLVAAGALVFAISAPASASFNNCNSNFGNTVVGCNWTDANRAEAAGSMMFIYVNQSGICQNAGSGWNDTISAVKNTTNIATPTNDNPLRRQILFYQHANCSSLVLTLNPGQKMAFTTSYSGGWQLNDIISSWKYRNCNPGGYC